MLRLSGYYGSPEFLFLSQTTSGFFSIQPEKIKTLIAFLNTEKYPPSLPFLLMTLGPLFLWLGFSKADRANPEPGFLDNAMTLFGRVPLFYYLLHLYLIHLLAILLGLVASQPIDWLLIGGPRTQGSGFALPVVYVAWITAVGLLYPLCKWYEHYKRNHDHHWLKYL